jgi:hypothetical protein
MEYLMDNGPEEQQFQEILKTIRLYKSGEIAQNMKMRGMGYKMSWGVSIMDLREISRNYAPSHLLALKLWNKQWRETMILATMLDDPDMVSEQQMDFWTKSFENSEIAEQASANLYWKTPFSYAKALEWCRGKKHFMHYTAVHLMGRLAMMDKKSPDEMFDPFVEELAILGKDPALSTVIERAVIIMAHRSDYLRELAGELTGILRNSDNQVAIRLAGDIEAGI